MKTLWTLSFVVLFLFSGCKKLSSLTQFNVSDNCETTISAGVSSGLPFDVFTPDITTNSENEYKSHNTNKGLIESIQLTQLTLTITSPSGKTFDFLKDIEIYISAGDLPEAKIASSYGISDNAGNQISLNTENINLKEYINQDTYKIRVRITTDKILSQDITVNIFSKYLVDAKILGL